MIQELKTSVSNAVEIEKIIKNMFWLPAKIEQKDLVKNFNYFNIKMLDLDMVLTDNCFLESLEGLQKVFRYDLNKFNLVLANMLDEAFKETKIGVRITQVKGISVIEFFTKK